MKHWNFGIIGAGLIADFHATAIQSLGNASLAGIAGSNGEKVRLLAEKHNCRAFSSDEEMLRSREIDVVTIATPSGSHMEPAVAAARPAI
jgi:UDP-N-acetyl-2-amino-2-deoxyglucuronate dehydrogenase